MPAQKSTSVAAEVKHCAECKDAFLPAHAAQLYCCKTCSNRAKSRAMRGKAQKPREARSCPTCGETFKAAAPRQKFCSRMCANKGRPKKALVTRTCRECRAKFQVYPSLERARGRVKFCSNACKGKWRKSHMPQKMARTYVDNLFSRLVRTRDGKCLYCSSTRNLQCSHIVSRSVAVLRADFDNAITLCYRHHIHFWHKDPIAAGRWFEETWPGRYDLLVKKKQQRVKVNWHDEFDRLRAIEAEWAGKPKPAKGPTRRTHCLRGHPLSGDNLTHAPNGTRRCKECHRLRNLASRRGITVAELVAA